MMRIVAGGIVALFLGFPGVGIPQDPAVPGTFDTGFRRDVHGWSLPNATSKLSDLPSRPMTWTALNGSCIGMARTAQAAFDPKDPGKPGLFKLTSEMPVRNRVHWATDAQAEIAFRAGRNSMNQTDRVPDVIRTIRQDMSRTGKPQVLLMNDRDGVGGHAILVTGYKPDPQKKGRILFTTYDPNSPAHDPKLNPPVFVEVDPGGGGFRVFIEKDGKRVIPEMYRKYDRLRHDADENQGEVIERLEEMHEDASDGEYEGKAGDLRKKQVVVTKDPEVGGVLIRFDPAIFSEDVSDEEFEKLAARVGEYALKEGKGTLAVRVSPASVRYESVSLDQALKEDRPTLKPLTRVEGYVLDPKGEFRIVGRVEPGRRPVSMDVLRAGLRAVFKEGLTPFISLDPDPADFSGPQKVRIGGLPEDLRNTEFVRIMIDADYRMKEITLGKENPKIAGFASWADLLRERKPRKSPGANRMWLVPLPVPGGLLERRKDGKTAVLFESEVQVLTESMKQSGDLLIGTGETDPLSEEAAARFTRHYPALEAKYPVFHELHGVFDVATLAALLRARGVEHPALDRAAAGKPAEAEIRKTYPGIGPRTIEGTTLFVSGGASARARMKRKIAMKAAQLDGLFDGGGEIAFPEAVYGDVRSGLALDEEVLINKAIALNSRGEYRESLAQIELALHLSGEDPWLKALRSVTLFQLGRVEEALVDIHPAAEEEPLLRAFRAILRTHVGDREGALADAEAAEKAHPDLDVALLWAGTARIFALDLEGADRTVTRLIERNPLNSQGYNLSTLIEFLWKLGPTRAKVRVEKLLKLPVPINDAYVEGILLIQSFDFSGGVRSLRTCLRLIEASENPAPLEAMHLRERCLMAMAFGLSAEAKMMEKLDPGRSAQARKESVEVAATLIGEHPDWPTGYLLKGRGKVKGSEARELFDRALAGDATKDPLLKDLGVFLGTDRALGYFGLTLWYQMSQSGNLDSVALLDRSIELLGDGLAGRLMSQLRDVALMPPGEALDPLRAAGETVPDSLDSPDPVTLWVLGFYYVMLTSLEEQAGNSENVLAAGRKYLRITRDLDDLGWEGLTQTAAFRFMVLSVMGQKYEAILKDLPRIQALRRDLANGKGDLDRVGEEVKAAYDEFLKQLKDRGETFTAGFLHAMLVPGQSGVRESLVGYARSYAEELPEGPERKARLEKLPRRSSEEGPEPRRTTSEAGRAEFLLPLVEGAETAVELRTISFFTDAFEMAARLAGEKGNAKEVSGVLKMLAPLKKKMNARSVKRKKHAWGQWVDPPAVSVKPRKPVKEKPDSTPAARKGPYPAGSPRELFASINEAMKAKDGGGFFDLLSKSAREEMLKDTQREIKRAKEDPEKGKRFQNQLGLDRNPATYEAEELSAAIFGRLMGIEAARRMIVQRLGGTFESVRRNGDRATVTVKIPGTGRTAEREVVREDGVWRLDEGLSERRKEPAPKKEPGERHDGEVRAIAASPDGTQFATAGGMTVKVWHPGATRVIRTFTLTDSASALSYSGDGALLAAAGGRTVHVWSASEGKLVRKIDSPEVEWTAVTLGPQGRVLAAGDGEGRIRLFDALTAKEIRTLGHWRGPVRALAFDSSGRRLASGGNDDIVRVWDLVTGTKLWNLPNYGGAIRKLRFLPGGERIVAAGREGVVRVWRVSSAVVENTHRSRNSGGDSVEVAISPDGETLARRTSGRRILLMGLGSGGASTLQAPSGLRILAFRPDGRAILSGGWDGSVTVVPMPE